MAQGDSSQISPEKIDELVRKQQAAAVSSTLIPVQMAILARIVLPIVMFGLHSHMPNLVGWNSPPSYFAFVPWVLLIAASQRLVRKRCWMIAVMGYQFGGYGIYAADRAAYGRSGGIDIAYWSSTIAVAFLLLAHFLFLHLASPSETVRAVLPWAYVLEVTGASLAVAKILTWIVYPITCGKRRRP